MNEVAILHGAKPRQILQTAIEGKIPAIMTYLSRGKWHVAKVLLKELVADKLHIEGARSEKKPHPINIQIHQPIGISFKYEHGKFIFDTTVIALEPSPNPASGGTIVIMVPDRIEVVQRRSYFRVQVPESLKVNVLLWHRSRREAENEIRDTKYEPRNYCQGMLADISAGGAQVAITRQLEANTDVSQGSIGVAGPDFKKGQFVGVRFTPMPYETPLMFSAQVRNVLPAAPPCVGRRGGLPAADSESIYLGLQIVGLEASPEGRQVLSRLVGVVERYFKINQTGAKIQDMRPVPSRP